MDRVAIFVDAGYLFAQSSVLLSGERRTRGEMELDFDKVLECLESFSRTIAGVPLLRIYWYDGTATGPSAQHQALAFKPRVKVRLGFVNNAGQQKGVDSLIITDMISLARNRAMSDAVLLSGDEDLRVGVQQAQEFGIRVHLLGITPCRGSQSQFLLQEADTTHEWTREEVAKFMSHVPSPIMTSVPAVKTPTLPTTASIPRSTEPLTVAAAARLAANEIDMNLIEAILANYESTKVLNAQIDRPLLGRAKRSIGMLSPSQIRELRTEFIAALKTRLPNPTKSS
ncbi:MAG TPA: NYN domain-containing protein [Verrucomicrobiae bacterium]|jgi:uncharacterized LabA/DUF88 family protein|nr:NYN domain-containing protein [Verrucomicrobiae bacterium]